MPTPASPLPCVPEDSSPIGLPTLLPLSPSERSNDAGTSSLPAVPAVAVFCSTPDSSRGLYSRLLLQNRRNLSLLIMLCTLFIQLLEYKTLFQYLMSPKVSSVILHGAVDQHILLNVRSLRQRWPRMHGSLWMDASGHVSYASHRVGAEKK